MELNVLMDVNPQIHKNFIMKFCSAFQLMQPQNVTFFYLETNSNFKFSYLITMGVSSNDNCLFPPRDKSWNCLADDWLTENCATQNVTNGAIGTTPHLF